MAEPSPSPQDLFVDAQEAFHAGSLTRAADLCRRILAVAFEHAGCLHMLGLIAFQQGRLDASVDLFRRSIVCLPGQARCIANLGLALRRDSRFNESLACLVRATGLRPEYAEAHNLCGLALKDLGRLDAAATGYRTALVVRPDYAEAMTNWGTLRRQQGLLDAAVTACRRAVHAEARSRVNQNNLAAVLLAKGQWMEAAVACRAALVLGPDDRDAHRHMGAALSVEGCLDEAATCGRRAVILDPDDAGDACALATTLLERGNLAEASAVLARAVGGNPDHVEAHWLSAIALLTGGHFEAGWREYEWRWQRNDPLELRPVFAQPLWSGEPSDGGTIALWAEQGYGDTLQMVRYTALVQALGWRVILAVPEPLRRIVATRPDVTVVTETKALGDFDAHCPLLSLPHRLGTVLATIPAGIPYLFADPALIQAWRARLGTVPGFRVGVAWRGSASHPRDATRSIEVACFAACLDVPGVIVVTLQKDARDSEIASLAQRARVLDLGAGLDDFVDTAALMGSLDLVISVDTAVCHLAGALGVATWTLLDAVADWRWMRDRSSTPWYPTMRLFRQSRPGDWQPVVDLVREALRQRVERHRR